MAVDGEAAGESVSLGDLSDLREGEMRSCPGGRSAILVCRVAGALYALEDLCSHADSPLSDGLLSAYTLTCALHGAQFDVRDGAHKSPPAYEGVACYDVTEGPDGARAVRRAPSQARPAGPPDGYFTVR